MAVVEDIKNAFFYPDLIAKRLGPLDFLRKQLTLKSKLPGGLTDEEESSLSYLEKLFEILKARRQHVDGDNARDVYTPNQLAAVFSGEENEAARQDLREYIDLITTENKTPLQLGQVRILESRLANQAYSEDELDNVTPEATSADIQRTLVVAPIIHAVIGAPTWQRSVQDTQDSIEEILSTDASNHQKLNQARELIQNKKPRFFTFWPFTGRKQRKKEYEELEKKYTLEICFSECLNGNSSWGYAVRSLETIGLFEQTEIIALKTHTRQKTESEKIIRRLNGIFENYHWLEGERDPENAISINNEWFELEGQTYSQVKDELREYAFWTLKLYELNGSVNESEIIQCMSDIDKAFSTRPLELVSIGSDDSDAIKFFKDNFNGYLEGSSACLEKLQSKENASELLDAVGDDIHRALGLPVAEREGPEPGEGWSPQLGSLYALIDRKILQFGEQRLILPGFVTRRGENEYYGFDGNLYEQTQLPEFILYRLYLRENLSKSNLSCEQKIDLIKDILKAERDTLDLSAEENIALLVLERDLILLTYLTEFKAGAIDFDTMIAGLNQCEGCEDLVAVLVEAHDVHSERDAIIGRVFGSDTSAILSGLENGPSASVSAGNETTAAEIEQGPRTRPRSYSSSTMSGVVKPNGPKQDDGAQPDHSKSFRSQR